MVRKVFSDERGNELELFINTNNEYVITIKNNDFDFHLIVLEEDDLLELVNEINVLLSNIKHDGI
jgi:hypothetical protein